MKGKGKGEVVPKGKTVTVKYTGKLQDGTKFDSGKIDFKLGAGEVIKCWDMAVEKLKKR